MLYREIIAVCSQIHTKHINTQCWQNVELLNDKPDGTYSNHWALDGYRAYFPIATVAPDYSILNTRQNCAPFAGVWKKFALNLRIQIRSAASKLLSHMPHNHKFRQFACITHVQCITLGNQKCMYFSLTGSVVQLFWLMQRFFFSD
jgi:hypothetical protein